MAWKEMNVDEIVSGAQGELFMLLEGRRIPIAQGKKIEAKMEKKKTEIPVLGKSGKKSKTTSWTGKGSLEIYYNTSIFRELAIQYIKDGKDFYFDIVVTNEDKTSTIGRQTIILKGCNFDSIILAKIATEDDTLSEEMEFTFEDVEMPEKFKDMERA
ncbi:MAG: phage tail tube protein [Peptostreptococcaceae bacterium]|nr:phage tail tube protein [Peptostreptococcaceae bacterium]